MTCCDEDTASDDNNATTKVRGCTDVLWLIIYILFWFLMVMTHFYQYIFYIHMYNKFGID